MRYKTGLALLGLIIGLSTVLLPGHSLATTGSIYLSPASNSVLIGDNITVSLRINPGTPVDAVAALVSFDSSKLQFVSDNFGSVFSQLTNTPSASSVKLVGLILGSSTNSDSLIATITLKALVGSGSDSLAISIPSGSSYYAAYNGVSTNPSAAGATVSFTTPPPPPPTPTPAPKATPATPPKASSTPIATPIPVAKAVLAVAVKSVSYTLVSVNVTSDIPVQTAIKYGTSSDQLTQITNYTTISKTSIVSLDPNLLMPGTTYYYQVLAKDAAGNVTEGAINTLTTVGYTLKVAVLDNNYKALAGKSVSLHSSVMTATTDSNGIATFTNVAPGAHHVTYAVGSKTYSEAVYVDNNVVTKGGLQTAALQNVAVVLTNFTTAKSKFSLGVVIVPLVLLIIIGALYIYHETTLITQLKAKLFILMSKLPVALIAAKVTPPAPVSNVDAPINTNTTTPEAVAAIPEVESTDHTPENIETEAIQESDSNTPPSPTITVG